MTTKKSLYYKCCSQFNTIKFWLESIYVDLTCYTQNTKNLNIKKQIIINKPPSHKLHHPPFSKQLSFAGWEENFYIQRTGPINVG